MKAALSSMSSSRAPAPRRGGLWLVALLVTSLALAAATAFTYRNATTFARERLVRAAVLYTMALENGARQLGPDAHEQLEDLLADATGEEVLGLTLVDRDGQAMAAGGEMLAADLVAAPWVIRAAVDRQVTTGAETGDALAVAVPTRLGCGRWGRGRRGSGPPLGRGRGGRGHGPCVDPDLALVLVLDATEARKPVQQAQIQALFVAAALLLAWLIAWRWHRTRVRARSLEEVARRRETLAALGEMAAVLAHEIRNPLGAIRGHAQLASKKLPKDERMARSLSTIVDETTRLSRLVDGLLRYSRPQPPQRRPVELGGLIDQVVALAKDKAAAAGVSVSRSEDGAGPEIACDPEQIEQVLLNLVHNGIEAQPDGGRIVVSTQMDGSAATIRVEDAGPGIPEESRDHVFSPFVTTRAEGSGLGLAIARQIVEAHGGSLEVGPSALGGAALIVRLPRSEANQ